MTRDPFGQEEDDIEKRIKGGVDYGFESRNIYKEVRDSGPSSSGEITDPAFTALGGYGFQKASFALNKSSIYSDTTAGRTHFYALERIGRISMLWNRAKHVIIYERSVTASEQFPDKKRDGLFPRNENSWEGRPVVRKVAEYIDILEPERAYPDQHVHQPEDSQANGFLMGVKFPVTRIPVDGVWSKDIPGGWIIPLYKKDIESDFYKLPEILLKFQAAKEDEEEEAKELFKRITNPEVLHFYTSTNPKDDDNTEGWKAVPTVDFPVEAIVPHLERSRLRGDFNTMSRQLNDQSYANPEDIQLGYDNFTLKLESGNDKINILAGRVGRGVEAAIDNITLARRNLKKINVKKFEQEGYRKLKQEKERLVTEWTQKLSSTRNKLENKALSLTRESDLIKIKSEITKIRDFCEDPQRLEKLIRDHYQKEVSDIEQKLLEKQKSLQQKWDKKWGLAEQRVKEGITKILKPGVTATEREVIEAFQEIENLLQAPESVLDQTLEVLQKSQDVLVKYKRESHRTLERLKLRFINYVEKYNQDLKNHTAETKAHLFALRQHIFAHHGRLVKLLGRYYPKYKKLEVGQQTVGDLEVELIGGKKSDGAAINGLVNDLVDDIVVKLDQGNLDTVISTANDHFGKVQVKLDEIIEEIFKAITDEVNGPVTTISNETRSVYEALRDLRTPGKEFKVEINGQEVTIKNLVDTRQEILELIEESPEEVTKTVDQFIIGIKKEIESAFYAQMGIIIKKAEIKQHLDQTFGYITQGADVLQKEVCAQLEQLISGAEKLLDELKELGEEQLKQLEQELAGPLIESLKSIENGIDNSLESLEQTTSELIGRFEDDLQNVFDVAGDAAEDAVFRVLRAFGDSPIADALALNRDKVAYYFHKYADEVEDEVENLLGLVEFTPSAAMLNRFGRELENIDLKTLGLRLPTFRLGERFEPLNIPELDLNLKKFDLNSLMSDVAGMELSGLFKNIKFFQDDGIVVEQGIDKKTRTAWARATVDAPSNRIYPVFDFGPIKLVVERPYFKAKTEIRINHKGQLQKKVDASVSANWILLVASQEAVRINNALLYLDNGGKIRFRMEPQNLVVHRTLQFITDLMQKLLPDGDGLTFELVMNNGIPIGVRALINVPIPAVQTGAFSMSNLNLHLLFELAAGVQGFYIATGTSVATKERPFNMAVLFIAGGGWFGVMALYRPFADRGKLSSRFSAGISLGASLPFDIGVARGGVFIFISLGVEYDSARNGGNLTVLLRLAIYGEVVLLSIVSIYIGIALEARYETGGTLTGIGTLRAKVKICKFFKIEVDRSFSKSFKAKGGSQKSLNRNNDRSARISRAVDNHGAAIL